MRRAIVPFAAVGTSALVLRLVYGRGLLGYDASAALVWGHDLWHGRTPDFGATFSPTPHPLSYLVMAPVSALGEHALAVTEAFSWLSFGLLGWAAFRLGRGLFSAPVGVAFGLIMLTRPLLLGETMEAFVDIPCIALVLLAAACEAERPHERPARVLVLLGLAGLMRPESWLLSAAYVLYALRGRPRRAQAWLLALAAAAPLLWMLLDLAFTGDALFSLHHTQSVAVDHSRPRGLGNALDLTPHYLAEILGSATVWCGLAGCLVGLWVLYRRSLLPLALLALSLGGFLVLGVADLPLLRRYLLPAGAVLALFCAVALLGWRLVAGRERRAWLAGGVATLVVLAATGPSLVRDLRDRRDLSVTLGKAERSLRVLLATDQTRAVARRCTRIDVDDSQLSHQVASAADVPERRIHLRPGPSGQDSLFVAAVSDRARLFYVNEAAFRPYSAADLPGYRRFAGNADWALWEKC